MKMSSKKLLVFPVIPETRAVASFHIPKLLKVLREETGITTAYVSAKAIRDLSCLDSRVDNTYLLVNWLDTLYESFVYRLIAIVLSLLPTCLVSVIAKFVAYRIENVFRKLKKNGYVVIFYFHDLKTFSRVRLYKFVDIYVREFFYRNSDCLLFAEDSARRLLQTVYGPAKLSFISYLGSYSDFHGTPEPKRFCREKLGISNSVTVLLSIGTLRPNRKNEHFISAVEEHDDLFLLAGGRGHRDIRRPNVISFEGFLDDSTLTLMIGATDYIIHSGTDYLTSATARLAMSYGIPVIAENFGSTQDMCRGALIDMAKYNFDLSRLFADLPRFGSDRYIAMSHEASLRDGERSWHCAAHGLMQAIASTH